MSDPKKGLYGTGDFLTQMDELAQEEDRKARRSTEKSNAQAIHMHTFLDAIEGAVWSLGQAYIDQKPPKDSGREPTRVNIEDAMAMFCRSLHQMSETALNERLESGRLVYNKAISLCESPIEKRFLPWLIFNTHDGLTDTITDVFDPKDEAFPPTSRMFLVPQMPFLRYRADFALIYRSGLRSVILAVECDGKDFHNAKTDLLRDGFFACFGIRTIRLTGSEIWNEPWKAAHRITVALHEAVR